jgi:hypothetical protein
MNIGMFVHDVKSEDIGTTVVVKDSRCGPLFWLNIDQIQILLTPEVANAIIGNTLDLMQEMRKETEPEPEELYPF